MARTRAIMTALMLWIVVAGLGPSDSPVDRAKQSIAMLRAHNFQGVADNFYEPPTYSPERAATDRASVAKHLAELIAEVGDFDAELVEQPQGLTTYYEFGLTGGDRPYSPSDVGGDDSQIVAFRAQFAKFGKVQLELAYVHLHGRWEVLSLKFMIPTTEPDAMSRLAALFAKTVGSDLSRKP